MIFLNSIPIIPSIFPDKTSQIWNLSDDLVRFIINNPNIEVHWDFENEAELFHVLQLSELIHDIYYKETFEFLESLSLFCPFLPYGRQDKPVTNESTFALKTFVSVIGEYYDVIRTIDAHPTHYADYGLIENIFPQDQIEFAIQDFGPTYICYPDKGAEDRYSTSISGLPTISMSKVRNQTTGDIEGLKFNSYPAILKGQKVLIIDDIADGGRTFVETAKLLKEYDVVSIALYVSHGLFTKGTQVLYDSGISKIYDKNGLKRINNV